MLLPTIEAVNPPSWWQTHGTKVTLNFGGSKSMAVDLSSHVVSVSITRDKGMRDKGISDYKIRYTIDHFWGSTKMEIYFTTEELEGAFGLSDYSGEGVVAVKRTVNETITCATQGKYIRKGRYLCLPGPGTSLQGDPNLSLYIHDEIREAMKNLITL
ncbi:MAG: hypothetical protein V1707_01385 [bacterium]